MKRLEFRIGTLVSTVTLFVLAACASPPAQPSGLTKHVTLFVGEQGFAFNYKVFAIASFSPFITPFDGALPEHPLADKADTCVVTTGDNTDPLAQFSFLAAPLGDGVSVGQTVSLEAGGTPYAALPERDFFGSSLYGSGPTEMSLAEPPLPASLTLTVPAGDYAAASGVTVTPVTRLEWTAPSGDAAITPATPFTWVPDDGGALIGFQVTQADAAGKDILNVFCLAVDDGNFSFPAETQQALASAKLTSGSLMQLGRIDARYERKGDTALLLASTSYLVYNLTP